MSAETPETPGDEARGSDTAADAGRQWVQDLEPGVDVDAVRSSASVGQASVRGHGNGGRLSPWAIAMIVFGVVAVAVLAFLIPVSAAPAWLGIAVQLGGLAWAAGTLIAARGRQRRAGAIPLVFAAQVSVTVVLLIVIVVVAATSGT